MSSIKDVLKSQISRSCASSY